MNCNWSANTALKTRDRFGEFIFSSPDSEKQPESCSLLKKKIQEDCSRAPHFSTECTDTDSSPTRNSSSITFWVSPLTSFWTRDCKPESIKKASKQNLFIKQESWSTKDTSKSARTSSMPTNSWSGLHLRRRSIWPHFLPSKLKSPAEPAERKTKEKSLPRNDIRLNIPYSTYHQSQLRLRHFPLLL